MDLYNMRDLRVLLTRHGFHFSKSMGQNFLVADWVPRRTAVESGADPSSGVLEVGPGVGVLTRELCKLAGQVVAVELDRALLPVLEETMAGVENFTLVPGDALRMDLGALADRYFPGLTPRVCANLPYNITTPLLTAFIEARRFASLTVMVQKEVAQRIAARPGTAAYGAFSVYMQYHTEPEVLFDVPPGCFLPQPKVTSTVVRCRVREMPAVTPACGEEFFFRVVRGAFALRRKTLVNSLAAALAGELDKSDVAEAIAACGLPLAVRGETLDLRQFAALADRLYESVK